MAEDLFRARKVMFVGGHPDDIEFYCGGMVRLMRQKGVQATFAIGTRGGKGRKGKALVRMEGRRTRDQRRAAEILGGADVFLFDHPDKALSAHIDEFADELRSLIDEERPDLVIGWDPDHIFNSHPDHRAAAFAAQQAAKACGTPMCFYGTREPNLWIGFDRDIFRVKYRALRAHGTETPWPYSILVKKYVTKRLRGEGRKIGMPYAEVLRSPEDALPIGACCGIPQPEREGPREEDRAEGE